MTVCIAAGCENGTAIVVASDWMLSAPHLAVEFDHPGSKIDQLNPRCAALSSGNALFVQDILADGYDVASKSEQTVPTIRELANGIKRGFRKTRIRRINELVFELHGTDFDTFYRNGDISRLPDVLAMALNAQTENLQLGTSLIVTGVDDTGAHIFGIQDPGSIDCWDRVGYHAIGIGAHHAMIKLVSMGQSILKSTPETIFNVYCAKKISESAPGVGTATTMKVITLKNTMLVCDDLLKKMATTYENLASFQSATINKTIQSMPTLEELSR